MFHCWTRDDETTQADHWQAEQLKLLRLGLDRKTNLCDEIAEQLRKARDELEEKNGMILEVRSSLATSNADFRALAAECAEHVAALEQLRAQIAALPEGTTIPELVGEVKRLKSQTVALASQSAKVAVATRSPRLACRVAEATNYSPRLASRAAENTDCCPPLAEQPDVSHQLIEEVYQLKLQLAGLPEGTTVPDLVQEIEELKSQVTAFTRESPKAELVHCSPPLASRMAEVSDCHPVVGEIDQAEVAHLREELDVLKTQVSALPEGTTIEDLVISSKVASEREATLQAELLQEKERCQEAARVLASTRTEFDEAVADINKERDEAVRILEAARAESEEKLAEMSNEREEALRLLQAARDETDTKVSELNKELKMLSSGLEEKEEDVLSIQFEMAALQNRWHDQAQLVKENAESFQWASEELAEKDEKFEEAVKQLEAQRAKQDELLVQIDDASIQFQAKVTELSQELEASRAAYRAMEEQTTKVVSRLEADRDAMAIELERVRAESKNQTSTFRTESQQREEAAAEHRRRLEDELNAALANLEIEQTKREFERRQQLEELKLPLFSHDDDLLTPPGPISPMPISKREQDLEEKVAVSEERLAVAETKLKEYTIALERSHLLERQALEQAEECRLALEMQREAPMLPLKRDWPGRPDSRRESPRHHSGFYAAAPRLETKRDSQESQDAVEGSDVLDLPLPNKMPDVLIAVEIFLGESVGAAVLQVTPWQTRSDFHAVVDDFLKEHHVKPMFANMLVQYLTDVENEATTFPVMVKASLADLYGRYECDD